MYQSVRLAGSNLLIHLEESFLFYNVWASSVGLRDFQNYINHKQGSR